MIFLETLYSVFSKYSLTNMSHCDCGCLNEEEVRNLAKSSDLRKIKLSELAPYQGSAIHTWGEIEHYKYYLPRILELFSQDRNGLINLDDILGKLEYANWNEWEVSEKESIKDFIKNDWSSLINREISTIYLSDINVYSQIMGLELLFDLWEITDNDVSVRNFVIFFFQNGNEFRSKNQDLIHKFVFKNDLKNILETYFFKIESSDKELAEKTSSVLQMIE